MIENDNNGNGETNGPIASVGQGPSREMIHALIGELQAVKVETDPTKAWAMLRETISLFTAQHLQD